MEPKDLITLVLLKSPKSLMFLCFSGQVGQIDIGGYIWYERYEILSPIPTTKCFLNSLDNHSELFNVKAVFFSYFGAEVVAQRLSAHLEIERSWVQILLRAGHCIFSSFLYLSVMRPLTGISGRCNTADFPIKILFYAQVRISQSLCASNQQKHNGFFFNSFDSI